MEKRYDGQRCKNSGNGDHGRRDKVESTIKAHGSDAVGYWYLRTEPRDSDRIAKRLPNYSKLPASLRTQPKSQHLRERGLVLIFAQHQSPSPSPRHMRNSCQGYDPDETPT